MNAIAARVHRLLSELPAGVALEIAAKGRPVEQIRAAVEGGARLIGENYVQEAEKAISAVGRGVEWHFIGHLQTNKVRRAVELFDVIETVDSVELAAEIDGRCARAGKTMPVLIEVNSAREASKSGALPEETVALARQVAAMPRLRLMGLMTMGALSARDDDSRPYFALTRKLFDEIGWLNLPGADMKYLSMGMTDSYRVAVEEGATLVRIGRGIFEG